MPIVFGPRGTKRKISAAVKQNSCQKNILKKDCKFAIKVILLDRKNAVITLIFPKLFPKREHDNNLINLSSAPSTVTTKKGDDENHIVSNVNSINLSSSSSTVTITDLSASSVSYLHPDCPWLEYFAS